LRTSTEEQNPVGMVKVQVWAYKCERCDHVWMPREEGVAPKVCPKCKSPYWDRPRRKPKEDRVPKE
jgi:Zn finger protein HypA/HybF involved in hydrogenase expression